MRYIGLDIGTNMTVAGMSLNGSEPVFKMQRDAYYVIVPKSEVNRKSIELSMKKREIAYIFKDGKFIIFGDDALDIAVERNDTVKRPMCRGIITPSDSEALPMLKLILNGLIGRGNTKNGDRVVYSVPGNPIDSDFDITYHREMMGSYIKDMGFIASPINEAYAVALSELLDDGLTGISISLGAGMSNICVVHEGDPLIEFSLTRGGDYIDNCVGKVLDLSPSIIQIEKENINMDLNKPTSQMEEALVLYYDNVINYTLSSIAAELNKRSKSLPKFRDSVPIVVSGGLTKTTGFILKLTKALGNIKFPIKLNKIKGADEPMLAVANGALLASQL